MKLFLTQIALASALVAGAVPMRAADKPAPTPSSPALAMLQSKGYLIGKSFDAGHGLTGWVVSRGGQPNVVFTTKDGQVLLIGAMVDATGANLTTGFVERFATSPELGAAYEDLAKAQYIAVKGASAAHRIVYVVFDPNCPYCSMTYKALKQYANYGVEFRWLPVAYLKPDSANRAEAIMHAKDPVAALEQNELQFDEGKHQGGVEPANAVSPEVLADLKQNDAFMHRIDANTVPTLLWKDDAGHVHQYVGLPPVDAMLDIVGVATPH